MAEDSAGMSSGPGSESDVGDAEFEPTAEMLVNDFDDERTLDEEEAMEEGSEQDEEVSNLQKEQDMPIEELLAMYSGYPPSQSGQAVEDNNGGEDAIEEEVESEEANADKIEPDETDTNMSRSSTSEENPSKDAKMESKPERKRREKTAASVLSQLYSDADTNGEQSAASTSRSLRSTAESRQESEDDSGSEGDGSDEEDWHKTIMIGAAYQAPVPEGLHCYGATPPYENADKLLWDPGKLTAKQVKEFLRQLSRPPAGSQGIIALPMGKHVRDDEQALYLLLQCGYNMDEALRRHRMNPIPLASTMSLWSEEECRNFENGLRIYGKDFHQIQQNKVRTRSVGELIQFYYLWKKTERHDVFATKTRIEKKKYIVHPGTTDYMDRFLDEGEGVAPPPLWRDTRSSSPNIHTLLYGRPPPPPGTGQPISDTNGTSKAEGTRAEVVLISPSKIKSCGENGVVATPMEVDVSAGRILSPQKTPVLL